MPIVEVHSPADMIVSLEGPQPVRVYPNIPAEINVYLFDTVAFKGFDGKSCYEYAVEGGYKGTEAEFTACMNKWLNEVCQADPIFAPHSAYFGFNAAETISDANIGTLTHDPANTLAAREWPVTNSQSPTPLYAHIIVPATVASYINTVGIKGGLAGIWGQAPVTIGGQPYIDIRSPYKFADASLTLVTTSKSGSISAMTWVTTNGQNILAHIANNAIHLSSQDRTKLDNLSGINTGDQDLSRLEPKKGVDEFYITGEEKFIGALLTGNTTLTTVNQVANKAQFAPNENGTILYHSAKWFTPNGAVSTMGTTVTSTSAQFTSAMVGAKLTIMGEERIISSYINSTSVAVVDIYAQNYSGIDTGAWGVYNKAISITEGTMRVAVYNRSSSTPVYFIDNNGNFTATSSYSIFNTINTTNCLLYGAGGFRFSPYNNDALVDARIKRSSAGAVSIDNGIDGQYRDLNVRNINYYGALTNASDGHLKENTREVTNGLQKALKLAKCVRHFTFKNQDAYAKGQRTGFMAQLLKQHGFEGHVSERVPRNEAEGVDFGWTYKDEYFEDANPETGEVEKYTRRVVDKEGTPILQIDTNFTPYLFKAIEELNDKVEKLEARLLRLEGLIK